MPPKPSAPKIEYRHNVARGEHEIGVRVGKHFVAFVQLPNAAFAQGLENAQNVSDEDASDDDNGDDSEGGDK